MEAVYRERFFDRYELDTTDSLLDVKLEPNASGSLQIRLKDGCSRARLHLEAGAYTHARIFLQNLTEQACELEIEASLKRDARIELGLLDLQESELKTKIHIDLDEQGASMELYDGQLCLEAGGKYNDFEIAHHADHTFGNMHNFSVVFDKGVYDTVAAGRIDKGCFGSESHQETRVLTMGDGHKTRCIPILYIDENDVKASHALSVGQPDENQLYYLCSRGLNKQMAMGLLSIGYFMPVIDLVEDEKEHEELRMEMERRVGLYGH